MTRIPGNRGLGEIGMQGLSRHFSIFKLGFQELVQGYHLNYKEINIFILSTFNTYVN